MCPITYDIIVQNGELSVSLMVLCCKVVDLYRKAI